MLRENKIYLLLFAVNKQLFLGCVQVLLNIEVMFYQERILTFEPYSHIVESWTFIKVISSETRVFVFPLNCFQDLFHWDFFKTYERTRTIMSSDSESDNNQSDVNPDEEVDETEAIHGSSEANGKNGAAEEGSDDKDVTWTDLVR